MLRGLGQWLCRICGAPTLQSLQHFLNDGEVVSAWAVAEELLRSQSTSLKSAEAVASLAVAAAATGRLERAAQLLEVLDTPDLLQGSAQELAGVHSVRDRILELLAQSRGEGALFGGENLGVDPAPKLQVPETWCWVAQLPPVAEFVGPLEIRWNEGCERGLFATRHIFPREVLLLARPLAVHSGVWAYSTAELVEQLLDACRNSARTRCQLQCLTDGWASRAPPTLAVASHALWPQPDSQPMESLGSFLTREALVNVVDRNSFHVNSKTAIYGLPSMINHSCGSVNASANILDPLGDAILFRAETEIAAGSEIFFPYFKVSGSLHRRRERSQAMGFSCRCERCAFEADTLPGTNAAAASKAAMDAFESQLRDQMADLRDRPEEAGSHCMPLLQEILSHTRRMALAMDHSWREREVAWYLHLALPLYWCGVWCCTQVWQYELLLKAGEMSVSALLQEGDPSLSKCAVTLVAARCELLLQMVLAWEHTDRHSYDHLKCCYMLYLAFMEMCKLPLSSNHYWVPLVQQEVPLWRLEERPQHAKHATSTELYATSRLRCETAFCEKFGVGSDYLCLGGTQCRVTALMRTLHP
ncbi:unnamed protein product [Symbiodinium natans]|uniref:SET domain-containing protein n=1 Tax=Symbiodinium natans TaxID=878477 RepID=A0A812M1V0_9DINO|nr:unnamed protein product [Symbiodinium natans]